MSGMSSLFSQMRESRIEKMNEEQQENQNKNLNEGNQSDPKKGAEGSQQENLGEEQQEVSGLFCSECGALVSGYMNESEVDSCPCCGSEELVEKVVKVVRDGEVVTKKVPTKKKRLSSAQKAALAKARKKAHSSSANKQRAKSIKKRSKMGLGEEDEFVCTECGYSGEYDDFSEDSDGNLVCPECGAIVEAYSKSGKKNEEKTDNNEDMKSLLESVNAPDFVMNALKDGKMDFVTGYLNMKMGK